MAFTFDEFEDFFQKKIYPSLQYDNPERKKNFRRAVAKFPSRFSTVWSSLEINVLGDVAIFSEDRSTFNYLEEFPVQLLHQLPQQTGIASPGPALVVLMEYGRNFSGPGKDIFREDRARGEPSEADISNFLHPVIYFYKSLPTETDMKTKSRYDYLPRPDFIHHVIEDFITSWDATYSHILPLRRFLENAFQVDQREFFSIRCFEIAMTMGNIPESCENRYLRGMGLRGAEDLRQAALTHGNIS